MLTQKETTKETQAIKEKLSASKRSLPRINLRPFVICALGVIFGILIYMRCRFGGLKASDFLFFALFLSLSIRPASKKRLAVLFLCFIVFAGAGASLSHLYTARFFSGMGAGVYDVTGTVSEFSVKDGYSRVMLTSLTLDGKKTGGKMSVYLSSEEPRAGNKLSFTTYVNRVSPQADSYSLNLFTKNVRYSARVFTEDSLVVSKGKNGLLNLSTAVYETLHAHMDTTEANTGYALLTGNSGNLDETFTEVIRQGGIAHIFAVSGLHIGILFSAVMLVLKPIKKLRRWRVIPAFALSLLYCAFCGFSVSSLRAVIMSTVLALDNALGRKYDFAGSVGFATMLVLLIFPAQWLSAGFRLSFGACMGLVLYSSRLTRAFRRLPSFLSGYLSASIAVQLFSFPVLYDSFGYFSVWGFLLNFFIIPVMPVLFLGLIVACFFALIAPPAAGVFLAVPNGMLSSLSFILAYADLSFVIKGFSLGAGTVVWLTGAVFLSERVRLSKKLRYILAGVFSLLFIGMVLMENLVATGSKVIVNGNAVLVQTRRELVLITDGDLTEAQLKNFLDRRTAKKPDIAIVLSSELEKISVAAPMAKETHILYHIDGGFQEIKLVAGESFYCGNLAFTFAEDTKLVMIAENCAVEFDFSGDSRIASDLFISGGNKSYYLWRGKVYGTS